MFCIPVARMGTCLRGEMTIPPPENALGDNSFRWSLDSNGQHLISDLDIPCQGEEGKGKGPTDATHLISLM